MKRSFNKRTDCAVVTTGRFAPTADMREAPVAVVMVSTKGEATLGS